MIYNNRNCLDRELLPRRDSFLAQKGQGFCGFIPVHLSRKSTLEMSKGVAKYAEELKHNAVRVDRFRQ
jgi:hypothetical protein